MDSYFIRATVIVIAPLVIQWHYYVDRNEFFKPRDLSIALLILLIYYVLGDVIKSYFSFDLSEFFWVSNVYNIIVIFILIGFVIKRSNLLLDFRRTFIKYGPVNIKLQISIIGFFVFISVMLYYAVQLPAEKVLSEQILLLAILEKPFLYLGLFLITLVIAVIGEEFTFRFFSLNVLEKYFSSRKAIIISALLWALIHREISFSLIVLGIILAYLYVAMRCVTLCIIVHLLYNLAVSSTVFYVYFKEYGVFSISPAIYTIGVFSIMTIIFIGSHYLLEKLAKKQPIL